MTVDEVAQVVHVSRATIYRRVADGSLQALRVGQNGHLRVQARDVEALLRPARAEETRE